MDAKDFMTTNVITCKEDCSVKEAAQVMLDNSFSVLPVVDSSENLVGILTESDFVGKELEVPHALASIKQLFGQSFNVGDIELIYNKAKGKKVSEVMSKNLITANPETSLDRIVNMIISKNLKRVPIVNEQKIVGIITRKNLIRAFVKNDI